MNFEEYKVETYKSLISISTEGYKFLLTLNGGALIYILSLLNKSGETNNPTTCIAISAICFVVGLLLCGSAMLFGYNAQLYLFKDSMPKHVMLFRCAMVSYIFSLLFFAAGCAVAVYAFYIK